jgi:hypothetical protein
MKPDRHAAVLVGSADAAAQIRPALFVYPTAQGFAWIEPSYRDPHRSGQALHVARGSLTMHADGFSCEGPDGRWWRVWAADAEDEDFAEDLKALAWAEADIVTSGRTLDEERQALKAVVDAAAAEA